MTGMSHFRRKGKRILNEALLLFKYERLFSGCMDPNDNFNELDEYFRYIAPNLYGFYFSSFFYAVTNEEKKEVHIILVEQKAYIIKFDFQNHCC